MNLHLLSSKILSLSFLLLLLFSCRAEDDGDLVLNDLRGPSRKPLSAFEKSLKSTLLLNQVELLLKMDTIKTELETIIDSRLDQLQTTLNKTSNWMDALSKKFRCKDGWHFFEDSCYFFSLIDRSWEEGHQECLKMDADYVKVTTNEERDFIANHLTENSWIGLTDQEEENTFKWISDGSLENSNISWWQAGEPSVGTGEHCIHYGLNGDQMLWNNYDCGHEMPFICEMNPRRLME